MFVPYCTRERVARAADITAPAWLDAEIDAAIEQGSRAVDKLVRRGDDTRPAFAPWTGTIEYDWPALTNFSTYRFWLGAHSLLSFTAATSGGENITSAALGYPAEYGPPYDALDVDQSTSSVLTTSSGIGQRSLSITGVWAAAPLDEWFVSSWSLGEDIDSSETLAAITANVGIGSLIRIGTERMIVTDRSWLVTLDTVTITASMADQSIAVASGTVYARGDSLMVNSERMTVRDITGNTLTVQRATDGSALAAHAAATVYVLRDCTLTRGALGTTPAAHSSGDAVFVYRYPAVVGQLAVAYALDQRAQETSAYARTMASGNGSERPASGAGIEALEDRVLAAYGRVLSGAV